MELEELEQTVKLTKDKMLDSYESMQKAMLQIRSGRANPAMVEDITVEVYGQKMPMKQLANISIQEARSIIITPWDKQNAEKIEKSINSSNKNLFAQYDGNIIRIQLPELNETTRQEMVKLARKKAEEYRTSIRNIRRQIKEEIKKKQGENTSKDAVYLNQQQIQEITDDFIKKIDIALEQKEKEILTI